MSKGYWRRPENAARLAANWPKSRKKKTRPAELPDVPKAALRKYEGKRVVASPAKDDDWHEFDGRVVGRHGPFLLVRDQEDNVFDVLPGNVAVQGPASDRMGERLLAGAPRGRRRREAVVKKRKGKARRRKP